jgi:histone H3/H4
MKSMRSSELGLSAMYRILKKAGAERVSDESANELRRIIEEVAENIAITAVDLVSQTKPKRVTVMRVDIRNAWLEKIKESDMDRFKTI